MELITSQSPAGRGRTWAGVAPATVLVAAAILLSQVAALSMFPAQAKILSLVFLVLAPLIAAGACLYRARRGGDPQGWSEAGLAMLLWAAGMGSNMWIDLVLDEPGAVPGLSMLFYVLYGVPLIFTAASPKSEPWHVRLVDGVLALAIGCLFFLHTFTFSTLRRTADEGLANLTLMFDVENAFIAIFVLVRYLASSDPARREFFRVLTIFAFVYLVTAGVANHVLGDQDFGGVSDVIIAVPFLLLAAMALGGKSHAVSRRAPSAAFALVVRIGSPLMLPATLVVVAILLVRHSPTVAVVGFVSAIAGYGLRNVLAQMRGAEEHVRLDQLARIDALTNLPNRRAFDEALRREWDVARREGGGIALLMIDIDHFKLLNDGCGHQVGDDRLRDVGRAIAACVTRAGDVVARYGGEEFVAIVPATNAAGADALAERMRRRVAALGLASPAPGGFVTVSIGMGWMDRIDHDDPGRLLAIADAALYDAKHGGRNRVARRAA